MAQRDGEEQPDAPDLGASVQLESSQSLEGPAGSADALDAGYVPPDRPFGLDEDGVTGAGMRKGDSHDQRLQRERPADDAVGPDRSGRITLAGGGAALETSDAMDGIDVGIDGGAASAEEAAMHELDAGIEPVDDDSPTGDPEVEAALADDPFADRAELDAAADARGGDEASRIDARPEAGGAAAGASGRADAGPDSGL